MKGRIFFSFVLISSIFAACSSPSPEPSPHQPAKMPAPPALDIAIDTVSQYDSFLNFDRAQNDKVLAELSTEVSAVAVRQIANSEAQTAGQPEQYNKFARVRSNC